MNSFSKHRVVVVALDGLGYSFSNRLKSLDTSPFLSELFEQGTIKPMTTTLPPVSSVAWASFQTGANPSVHGITGFVDRLPGKYDPFVPTFSNLRVPSVLQHLSDHHLKVCSIGLPLSYPPPVVNGVVVSGFLAPSLERAVYPQSEAYQLNKLDYIIDIDAWAARASINSLWTQIPKSLSSRLDAAWHYLGREQWDFFLLHIIETDRLNHFLYRQLLKGNNDVTTLYANIYSMVDRFLKRLSNSLTEDTYLILISDHGFCELKKTVYVNHWLKSHGYLKLASEDATSLNGMLPESKAFSMAPGRIYLHTKQQCPKGSVNRDVDADSIIRSIAEGLMQIKDPNNGDNVIREVVDIRNEWNLSGLSSYQLQLPDLILIPEPGYELKGDIAPDRLFGEDQFTGAHSYGDALLYIDGMNIPDNPDITDIAPTICSLIGTSSMPNASGRNLLSPSR